MNKKFTLIEMVVSIVIIGILASIVTLKILDFKKQSIASAISQNTRILQGSVDEYFIKNERYPILFEEELTIHAPKKIDIDLLMKEGYLKKELDTSKIKEHYYWVDVFGKVWGNTHKELSSVNLLGSEGSKSMEFILGEKVEGYNLYEVSGYDHLSYKPETFWFADKAGDKLNKYKIVDEVRVTGKEKKIVQFDIPNNNSDYLVSTVDEYGLEGPPAGKFSSLPDGDIPALIKKEGVYEFEIESLEDMYWIRFLFSTETPGESTIDFEFKVKDEKGDYQEWTTDFYSLPPSTAIKVKVDMKGDDKGNKPSLYYSRILFKYKDETNPPIVREKVEKDSEEQSTCPPAPVTPSLSKKSNNAGKGTIGYTFTIHELEEFDEMLVPKVYFDKDPIFKILDKKIYISNDGKSYSLYDGEEASGKCMYVLYEVELISVKKDDKEVEDSTEICGTGGSSSNSRIRSTGKIVYHYYLPEGQKTSDIKVTQKFNSYNILNIYFEYSHQGKPYQSTSSILDLPSDSCVNIVYEVEVIKCMDCSANVGSPVPPKVETCFEKGSCPELCKENCKPINDNCKVSCSNVKEDWCDTNPCGEPICIEFEGECVPPVCTENCSSAPPSGPEPKDKVLQDPEWTTVDTLTFFGQGAYGQRIRWYRAEHNHNIIDKENTRIVYRYAKTNGYHWSKEYDDFETTGIATSVMARAYIQVKTSELKKVKEESLPVVISLKFFNERGFLDMSMVQPTLVIVPNKDNNAGREEFSNASNIEWTYTAADPRNVEIVDVEWDGDIREKYPVGTYEVKARVKNKVAIWSEWVTYILEVKEEKPVAIIEMTIGNGNKKFVEIGDKVKFSMAKSYDPDGDKIVNYEWQNKKDTYEEEGTHVVKLRVQDEEGHWSDWTEHEVRIGEKSFKIYRIEGEDKNPLRFVRDGREGLESGQNYIYQNPNASGGKGLAIQHALGFAEYKFTGSGFDIVLNDDYNSNINIILDRGTQQEQKFNHKSGEGRIISLRGLEEKVHTVFIQGTRSYTSVNLDYIDIFSSEDTPQVRDIYSKVLNGSSETVDRVSEFSPILSQNLKIYYELIRDSSVLMEITDSKGNLVRTYKPNGLMDGGTAGLHYFIWNGKDNDGNDLPTGKYTFKLFAKGVNNQGSTSVTHSIFLSNERPIYRIEGEDNSPLRLVEQGREDAPFPSNVVLTDATLSNGAGFRITHNKGYAIYQFEGDGIDLMFREIPAGVDIYINEKKVDEKKFSLPPSTEQTSYSIRNLEDKLNVVKISNKANNIHAVLDYIDVYSQKDKPRISDIYSHLIDNNVESAATMTDFSPKLSQQIKLYFRLFKDANTTINIKNNKGEIVRTQKFSKPLTGGTLDVHTYVWNGKNQEGEILKTGYYDIEIVATGVQGKEVTKTSHKVFLSNDTPIYRIEGEDNSPIRLLAEGRQGYASSPNYIVTDTSYSNEKAMAVRHNGGYATYKMEGTGFDIFIPSMPSKGNIVIDEGKANAQTIDLNKGENIRVSIRNLDLGLHTIRVNNFANNTIIIVDYIDVYSSNDQPRISDISLNTTQNDYEVVGTNSFNLREDQRIKLHYRLFKDSYVKVDILSPTNSVVKTINVGLKEGGTIDYHNILWDGRDSSGNKVPNGKYKFKFTGTGIIEGLTSTTEYVVYVSNENAPLRIEAETTDSNYIVAKGRYNLADANRIRNLDVASGGKDYGIQHSQGYATYKFTGTGVDIAFTSLDSEATIILNKGTADAITYKIGKTTNRVVLPIRGLQSKQHTITIENKLNYTYLNVDYLDVY